MCVCVCVRLGCASTCRRLVAIGDLSIGEIGPMGQRVQQMVQHVSAPGYSWISLLHGPFGPSCHFETKRVVPRSGAWAASYRSLASFLGGAGGDGSRFGDIGRGIADGGGRPWWLLSWL